MTELTVMRDIKRSLIKAELDAYLSTGSTESLHGVRDACTDLEVIEARLEERAGRIKPTTSSFAAFAPCPHRSVRRENNAVGWIDRCDDCGMPLAGGPIEMTQG